MDYCLAFSSVYCRGLSTSLDVYLDYSTLALFQNMHRLSLLFPPIPSRVCPICHFCLPAFGASDKEFACPCQTCRRCHFDPWVRKILWRRKWQPTPVFLPGRSHGRSSLAGYRPWGCKSQTQLSGWAHTRSYRILYVHILSYDLLIQRNAILIHATAWMNLVKEISHKASHIVCFHRYEIFRLSKSTGTESRLMVS